MSNLGPMTLYDMERTADASTTVAIAGATGFVGRALLAALPADQTVVALTRGSTRQDRPHRIWRRCNLFNLLHTETALQGVDTAFYLVHSMSPQAALTQGCFADMDLICADNFGRAARRAGVRHIIYLGGIIPPGAELSEHLRSRLEVEQALGDAGVPVTALRAGLVLGPGGSSFRMMKLLVRRLPLMLTPTWTRSRTQPVALRDVVQLLLYCMSHPETAGQHFDLGCPEVVTYEAMMRRTAQAMGRVLRIITVPVESLRLSLWWVSLITQTPRQLVLPLVQSLRHDMVATDGLILQQRAGLTSTPFDEALRLAIQDPEPTPLAPRRQRPTPTPPPTARTVVSVQRMSLPAGTDATWVAREYARWVPRFMGPWLRVEIDPDSSYRFYIPLLPWPLLKLTYAGTRSDASRQLFYISGGLLARSPQHEPGRFEFRVVLGHTAVLSAVHDFVPRLPWYLYKATQALAHRLVMHFFGRHLRAARSEPVLHPDGAGGSAS